MFRGSMVALVTPMTASGEIDEAGFKALIDWHIEQGTKAIIVAGTTGESGTLTQAEKRHLAHIAVRHGNERIPIIAGISATSTAVAISTAREFMEEGVDACLVLTPPYIKPTQEGLYLHFQAIAQQVAIPIILYNVPSRTQADLLPETVCRLSRISNIVGIKEATGDMERIKAIKATCGDSMDIYSGDDATAIDCIFNGGKGVISVTANVMPAQMQKLCQHALAGEREQALALQAQLLPLHQALMSETNPIPVKWALHAMQRIGDGIRLPLTELSAPRQQQCREVLQQLGCLS